MIGCMSARSSNASTPTSEYYPMAFDADFPFGTIKRKPSLQPKIPLTSTTRNLAKQSDDALVEIESSSSGEEGSGKNFHYGTLRLRRSLTDEKLKHLIYEKVNSRKEYDSVSGSTCSTTPPSSDGAVEDEEDDLDLPLPPPPETLSSSLSTLSLISLPPPPDEYLDSPPAGRTPEALSANHTPTSGSPLKSPPSEERANNRRSGSSIASDRSLSDWDSSSGRLSNHSCESGAVPNDLGLSELMRLVDELQQWKPETTTSSAATTTSTTASSTPTRTSHNTETVPNKRIVEERIYDTVEKNNTPRKDGVKKARDTCLAQPIYQEIYHTPERVKENHAYVNLNSAGDSSRAAAVRCEVTDPKTANPLKSLGSVNSQTYTKAVKVSASYNNPPPLSQRSPMKGPLPPPPDFFLRDLHRVMEKKWKVAQKLSSCTQGEGQILGFRDPNQLSSASSSSSFESSSSSSTACLEECQAKAGRPLSIPPVIPVMKLRGKTKKTPPPPPPRRSATTQLSQPDISRRIKNRGTVISANRSHVK